ncbi:hypothetical protein L1987_52305 [Smallanthus sonchifolius]|uniref:Uncharacterized protein n=1 Tax=Smallanthus sonchifolius TaxID=185202 RepID=A0ACB9ETH6_9ASTR|nr:hypothetical protein L1987_52305 [Smallanthus sonchifolius]
MGTETKKPTVEFSETLLHESSQKKPVIDSTPEMIPEWKDQITLRGLIVSALLGTLFCIISHKLNLTVGIIPSLNVAAGLLGFFCVKSWTTFIERFGVSSHPFTRQENTVIQTCIVACYGLAFSDIFENRLSRWPSSFFAAEEQELVPFGRYPVFDKDNCTMLKSTTMLFLQTLGCNISEILNNGPYVITTIIHLESLVWREKKDGGFGSYLLSMDERTYNLIGTDYPGNRAEDTKNPGLLWMTGFMFIVSFLGLFSLLPLRKVMLMDYKLTYPSGTATAMLINSFHTTTGAELARFYFDFSATYVGCGLICPHIVNCSVLFGAIISWGLLWPFITTHAGDWYPAGLDTDDFKGLYGYKVFIAIALILGDGFYNLVKIIVITIKALLSTAKQQDLPVIKDLPDAEVLKSQLEKQKREEVFLKDKISTWFAASWYVGLAAISTATMPLIFPPLKWYLVLCSYIIAPAFAFCNSYGCGLTDWSLASTYGKIGLFIISSFVGSDGGVIAGLAGCGVMMSIVSTAADLMQDFKTGYLTLSSAKSMFVSQLVGTAMGCIIAPLTFWMYWTAFEIGAPDSPYKAPYAVIFREMAILAVEGFSELPKHCLALCYGFFTAALALNLLRDQIPSKVSRFIPIPMAMAVPFYIGAYFAIDMVVGTIILFVWERRNKKESEDYAAAVASGLICGDGIWTIPSAILSIFRIDPPICMYFRPSVNS